MTKKRFVESIQSQNWNKINELDVTECKVTDTVEWDIDKVEVSDFLLVSGWALIPGEKITSEILDYISYAKEKGCFLTGTEDVKIENINIVEGGVC